MGLLLIAHFNKEYWESQKGQNKLLGVKTVVLKSNSYWEKNMMIERSVVLGQALDKPQAI